MFKFKSKLGKYYNLDTHLVLIDGVVVGRISHPKCSFLCTVVDLRVETEHGWDIIRLKEHFETAWEAKEWLMSKYDKITKNHKLYVVSDGYKFK